MRFASARIDGERRCGLVEGERLRPLVGPRELGPETGWELLRDPPLEEGEGVLLDEVELLPAIPSPGKIVCVGLNYRAHVDEAGRELPEYPVLFTKFASSLVGPYADIVRPPESEQVDFEGELAVVVGAPLRRASATAASAAIAGFAVANDVTMRDYQYKTHQWLQGKAWDRSTPLGPYLVTPDEVGDPGQLAIALDLNGVRMQESRTDRLIFDVPTLVSTISAFATLQPGDVVLTGTPGGVGYRRDPQVFLEHGDVVRVEVERVGAIENRVVDERP